MYLIKEFQRLKNSESEKQNIEWNIHRTLAKVNYHIHTDAIKQNLIPKELSRSQINFIYASEADLLNVSLFGFTAKQWTEANPNKDGNLRDAATIEQLVVLPNLESINSVFISQKLPQSERLIKLNAIAVSQMKSLINNRQLKNLK